MIFRHPTHLICYVLIVSFAVRNIEAIFFDDIFEYIWDGMNGSDESSSSLSEEFSNSNLNVTCKNCSLTVQCHNCTHHDKNTVPVQRDPVLTETIPVPAEAIPTPTPTLTIPVPTPTIPVPTPTIPAPERVVEIVSSNNVPTVSENVPATVTTQDESTNVNAEEIPAVDIDPMTGDANSTPDTESSSSDGVI